MFGRSKSTSASSTPATPPKPGGKGRPTPTRKEAEAAARARAKVPRTRKEQMAAQRLQRSESSRTVRERMKAGDEKYLPPRDQGPVRRFVRDYVDSRLRLAELIFPVVIVSLPLLLAGPSVAALANTVVLGVFLLVVVDLVVLRFRLRREVRARFPEQSLKGLTYYAVVRATQMRFMRLPKAQVKVGEDLPETYR
ncbi:DUF3043 domain-containing protein [Nocardioides sp. TRM66260-LWL]|uniref:DUF3043 domain-containing protein n=1 Tax=Nocardioides sp. TRM66260-LWL TaxID=2874478 RepID=UPI001CC4FA44|nr:DUF3043 domain-containing protein [Nocardioides sp. TRM66260-LWL]MBZ5734344.1 DUF3043 domain-containing protein [Nocardioides sp. TRM66260-LWL]